MKQIYSHKYSKNTSLLSFWRKITTSCFKIYLRNYVELDISSEMISKLCSNSSKHLEMIFEFIFSFSYKESSLKWHIVKSSDGYELKAITVKL